MKKVILDCRLCLDRFDCFKFDISFKILTALRPFISNCIIEPIKISCIFCLNIFSSKCFILSFFFVLFQSRNKIRETLNLGLVIYK